MFVTILLSALILLVAVLAMGVKVLFVKNGKFPSSHVCSLGLERSPRKVGSKTTENKNKKIQSEN